MYYELGPDRASGAWRPSRAASEAIANLLIDAGGIPPLNRALRRATMQAARKGLSTVASRLASFDGDYGAVMDTGLRKQAVVVGRELAFVAELDERYMPPISDQLRLMGRALLGHSHWAFRVCVVDGRILVRDRAAMRLVHDCERSCKSSVKELSGKTVRQRKGLAWRTLKDGAGWSATQYAIQVPEARVAGTLRDSAMEAYGHYRA